MSGLARLHKAINDVELLPLKGRINKVSGPVIHVTLPEAHLGELCLLYDPRSRRELLAEVVAFEEEGVILTPIGDMRGLSTRTEVVGTGKTLEVPVGPDLLGRVVDSFGRPLDEATKGHLPRNAVRKTNSEPPAALIRKRIAEPLTTGVRAIDGLLTVGCGQRTGIFGPPGCGKSTLLADLVKGTDADVAVLGLIGERGREVREFIEGDLGPRGLERSVVVVATSDRPAMERVKAADTATTIAEHFRDQGLNVLLLVDSLTRYARALRDIGLAAGETPARRGFPPSVFSQLPCLLERAGNNDKGSITGIYTVLVEGEDLSEPVAEETRAILDGHIILDPELAARGHYPAIDVVRSTSRVMGSVAGSEHLSAARHVRGLLSRYREVELLIQVGEYQPGHDAVTDEAVAKNQEIMTFLRQAGDDQTLFANSVDRLRGLAQ